MKKVPISLLLALLTVAGYAAPSGAAVPTNISLYEQPDVKSRVIEAVAPGTALIPIFNQGEWLKVGDPTNGQIGWINNETLPAQNRLYIKTITKNAAGGDNASEVIQYTSTEKVDEQQMAQLMQNLQKRQAELQQVFDQVLNQSVSNFNVLLRQLNQQTSRPLVTPERVVIIAPAAKTTITSPPAPSPSPKPDDLAPSLSGS